MNCTPHCFPEGPGIFPIAAVSGASRTSRWISRFCSACRRKTATSSAKELRDIRATQHFKIRRFPLPEDEVPARLYAGLRVLPRDIMFLSF